MVTRGQRKEEGNLGEGEELATPDCPGALSLTLFFRPGSLLPTILAAAQFPLHLPVCLGQYPRSSKGQSLSPLDSPCSRPVPAVRLLSTCWTTSLWVCASAPCSNLDLPSLPHAPHNYAHRKQGNPRSCLPRTASVYTAVAA